MTHPGAPRDVDLAGWLDGTRHHAPTDQRTILAHEAARRLVGELGATLHQLLPPGRDKSVVFTQLEDLLMRMNRAIAINGGPGEHVTVDDLNRVLRRSAATPHTLAAEVPNMSSWTAGDAADYLDAVNDEVNRIHPGMGWVSATESRLAEAIGASGDRQRAAAGLPEPGERTPLTPEKPFTRLAYTRGEAPDAEYEFLVQYQEHWVDPQVTVALRKRFENGDSVGAGMDVDDPEVLEEFAAGMLAAANRLRAAHAGR